MDCDNLKENVIVEEKTKQMVKDQDEKTNPRKRDVWFKGSRDRGLRQETD
tara:strand:- start:2963 stop:3112 length:150 start_codon:yes stop_codon:yes gene_type:complete